MLNNTSQAEGSPNSDSRRLLSEIEIADQKLGFKEIYGVVILAANNAVAFWMAFIVVYVNPGDTPHTSMEKDLGLTQTEYGLLSGVTYSLLSALFSIFSGSLVDKFSRKWTLVIAAFLWSGLTFTQSFATNFVTIIIPRIVMEIALTANQASSLSLISDYFNSKYRARACSFYQFGLYVGLGFGSFSIIITKLIGWRNAFRVCAGFGGFIAFLTIFISEPQRGKFNSEQDNQDFKDISLSMSRFEKLKKSLKIIFTNKICIFLCLSNMVRIFGTSTIGFWAVRFFKSKFPDYQNEYSIFNGISLITINLISLYVGGALGDHYDNKNPAVKSYIVAIGCLISFPFLLVAFVFSTNFWLSSSLFMLSFLFSESWYGNVLSMIQNVFPSQLVGSATAVFLVSGGISGACSNLLLGILSDKYHTSKNPKAAGNLLIILVGISYIGSAPLFIISGYFYKKYILSKSKGEKCPKIVEEEEENEE
ncbi:unnamed protein product [Moneuplotes crassus]|uniref:Major facilitator superfamily (MFS) profile domain-containing protein n=1 Tax=Euplotes crassus TaxID=5936 RepID=A0AAD1UI51_EUPCR|nr:unnamed protein product [Moneuplotes crassus]